MDERMSAAEVIAASLNTEIVGHSGDYNGGRLTYSRSLDLAIQGLDALREAGWEVVKLPEPTGRWAEGPEWRDFISGAIHAVVWTGDAPGSTVMVQNVEPGSLTPDQAHDLAAALLAAAAAVSHDGDSDA